MMKGHVEREEEEKAEEYFDHLEEGSSDGQLASGDYLALI